MEGIQFHFTSAMSSAAYGQGSHIPIDKSTNIPDDVKKIKVTYCDKFITSIEFLNATGQRLGDQIGQASGNGISGEVREVFIGLLPGEKVIGIRLQEIKLADKFILIGRIKFIFCGPLQNHDKIHYCYSGKSEPFDKQKELVEKIGAKLLTVD